MCPSHRSPKTLCNRRKETCTHGMFARMNLELAGHGAGADTPMVKARLLKIHHTATSATSKQMRSPPDRTNRRRYEL